MPPLFSFPRLIGSSVLALVLFCFTLPVGAVDAPATARSAVSAPQSPKKLSPIINKNVLSKAVPENVSVIVFLSTQRLHFLVSGEVAIDSPVSTGRRRGWTPVGNFVVVQKNPDHRSTLYGNFVGGDGKVVRSGVSARIHTPPEGASFVGSPMKWFMRLGKDRADYSTVGMHAGPLPGYPASHGCIRMPDEVAKSIFQKAPLGMPVVVVEQPEGQPSNGSPTRS